MTETSAGETCPDCGRPRAGDESTWLATGANVATHCFGHLDGDYIGSVMCKNDTIARLRSELAAAKQGREWIACDEVAPSFNQWVLVRWPGAAPGKCSDEVARLNLLNGHLRWFTGPGVYTEHTKGILWMALPTDEAKGPSDD